MRHCLVNNADLIAQEQLHFVIVICKSMLKGRLLTDGQDLQMSGAFVHSNCNKLEPI